MPGTENEIGVRISILDRLIDYEPGMSREMDPSRPKRLRSLRDAVRRDIEFLLNTRQVELALDPELKELNKSVAAYGLPDFTSLNPHRIEDQKEIRRHIEDALSFFEPRLDDVVVSFHSPHSSDRLMHFRITARLKVDPEPEPVTFDTIVQTGSGEFVVREE